MQKKLKNKVEKIWKNKKKDNFADFCFPPDFSYLFSPITIRKTKKTKILKIIIKKNNIFDVSALILDRKLTNTHFVNSRGGKCGKNVRFFLRYGTHIASRGNVFKQISPRFFKASICVWKWRSSVWKTFFVISQCSVCQSITIVSRYHEHRPLQYSISPIVLLLLCRLHNHWNFIILLT